MLLGGGEHVCLLFLHTRTKTTATSDVALSREEDNLIKNLAATCVKKTNESRHYLLLLILLFNRVGKRVMTSAFLLLWRTYKKATL